VVTLIYVHTNLVSLRFILYMQLGESVVRLSFDDWNPRKAARVDYVAQPQRQEFESESKHSRRKRVQTTAFTPQAGKQHPLNATVCNMAGNHVIMQKASGRIKIKEPRRLRLSSVQLTRSSPEQVTSKLRNSAIPRCIVHSPPSPTCKATIHAIS
jgi:hypothetical protein